MDGRGRRGGWRGWGAAVCAALILGASAAVAAARTAPLPMVGINGETLMTLALEDRCLMVSADRGTTWTEHPGLCFAGHYRRARLGGAMLVADLSNKRITRVTPDGASSVLATSAHGSFAGLVGGDGRGYVIDREPGVVLVRAITASGFAACGPLPGIPGDTTVLTLEKRGDSPVLAARTTDGENRLLISHDECATWDEAPAAPEGCAVIDAGPDAVYASCASPSMRITHRLAAGAAAWEPAHPLLALGALGNEPTRFVEAGGALRAIDRYGLRNDPAGWPAAPAASQQPGHEAVFEWIDQRFRLPLGLPRLSFDVNMGVAAQGHADYWALNGYSGHVQQAGDPGFTGASPTERCVAAGGRPCGEVATSAADPMAAADLWLRTPFHGEPFFSLATMAVGSSAGGTVINYGAGNRLWTRTLATIRPGTPVNSAEGPQRVWPHDGAGGVPLTWAGNETPDPLVNYTGDRDRVGPMIFGIFFEPATVSLWGPDGRLELLVPNATTTVDSHRHAPVDAGGVYEPVFSVFAAHPLAADTCYEIRLAADVGPATAIHFRSAGAGDPAACRPETGDGDQPPDTDGQQPGGGGDQPPGGGDQPSGGGDAPTAPGGASGGAPAAPGPGPGPGDTLPGGTIAGAGTAGLTPLSTRLTATQVRVRVRSTRGGRITARMALGRRTVTLAPRTVRAGRTVWLSWPRPAAGLPAGRWTLRLTRAGSAVQSRLVVRPAPRVRATAVRQGRAVVVRIRAAVPGVVALSGRRGAARASLRPRAVGRTASVRLPGARLVAGPGARVTVRFHSAGRATAIRTLRVR